MYFASYGQDSPHLNDKQNFNALRVFCFSQQIQVFDVPPKKQTACAIIK
jgi:hypothetical protein